MRSKVHKFCIVATLALVPAAAGCSAYNIGPGRDNGNPPLGNGDHWYGQDGFVKGKDAAVRRVFFDYQGSLYPDPAEVPIDDERFEAAGFSLRTYFDAGEYDADRISEGFARRLEDLCGKDRTLVVLIHGFNISYPEAYRTYLSARQQIVARFPGRKLAFLEVYWDGYYGSPMAIWPLAQVSSKWAGLGLRNLLQRIDPAIPVRVVTHSRGASVICAALWDTPMRGTVDEDRRYRKAQQARPPTLLPSVRVGLLAPAMRPVDLEGASTDVLVLGINKDDPALKAGGLSCLAGTSLGCTPEYVEPIVSSRTRASLVDFSASEMHAFQDYVLRDAFAEAFLPRLFGEDPATELTGGR